MANVASTKISSLPTAAKPSGKPTSNDSMPETIASSQFFETVTTKAPKSVPFSSTPLSISAVGRTSSGTLYTQSNKDTTSLLPRRPLPWLDGKSGYRKDSYPDTRQIPGAFISSAEVTSSSGDTPPSPAVKATDTGFLRKDPSLRPIGSTPSLRRRFTQPPVIPPRPAISQGSPVAPDIVTVPVQVRSPTRYSPTRPGIHSVHAEIVSVDSSSTSGPEAVTRPVDLNLVDITSQLRTPSPEPNLAGPLKDEELSPKAARRKSNPFDDRRHSLTDAISGLENLMQQAIDVAMDAAEQQKPQEVSHILGEATRALRRASAVSDRQGTMFDSPLRASDSAFSTSTSSRSRSSSASSTVSDAMITNPRDSIFPPLSPNGHNIDLERGKRGRKKHRKGSSHESLSPTPPRFYEPQAGNPVALDWAYAQSQPQRLPPKPPSPSPSSSTSSKDTSPRRVKSGKRKLVQLPPEPMPTHNPQEYVRTLIGTPWETCIAPSGRRSLPAQLDAADDYMSYRPRRSSYYHIHEPPAGPRRRKTGFADQSRRSSGTDRRLTQAASTAYLNSLDPTLSGLSLKHPRRNHHSLKGRASRGFSLGRSSRRRQPIARNWNTGRKRIVATIACVNTGLMGFIIGVYAGEVPRIQYQLADQSHQVILGNVVLYLGLAITTFIFWPLPLLHGRKPYILLALGLALPLQFPQAVIVDSPRSPKDRQYIAGLLLSRAVTGLILGFANINFLPTLFDLFGASLQSSKPHQEIVYVHDIRRHGGGMGMWLGIWTWCFIGMLAIGFCTGAGIIADLNPSWGFYIVVIVTAFVLFLNVVTPETRREHWRKSVAEFVDEDDEIKKRVARGEVKLHISMDGPKWWHEEVSAGVMLSFRMLFQRGFFLLALYLGWIYAQVVLVIVLLGALLSREYRMQPQYVGLGVFSLAIGALLATPLSKAGIFSRARKEGPRTDSMTFQERITWTSHLARRLIFMILLPFAGFVYTMVSWGRRIPFIVPCVFAGVIGFLSNLAIAECYGLVMETFDTSDLQPGVNSRHRLQSLAEDVRRRRTNYSSFPRVISGIFVSQSFAFLLAAAATGVGGALTRRLGAQAATGVTAGVLLFLTIGLTLALWRFKEVQVIPNHAFGTRRNTVAQEKFELEDWKPVVIGNPSGKMRRVNVLELGRLSRWTEIRRLNRLLRDGDEGF